MTLADIERIPREFLWAKEIAPLLDASEETICWQAKHEPDKLGFPVIVTKKHVKIPKDGFLNYWRYGKPCINIEVRPEQVQYYIDQAMQAILSQINNKGA